MKINKDNYESYFLDYLEGNLDESLVNDFIEFLQKNPDLKQELSLYEPFSLKAPSTTYSAKHNLYKEKLDLEKEFDQAAVAYLEGDLSVEERAAFEKYVDTHPDKKKDLQLFELSILHPDESIEFTRKRSLIRTSRTRKLILWSARIAAILFLATISFLLLNNPTPNPVEPTEVAKLEDKKQQKQEIEINSGTDLPLDQKKKVKKPVESIQPEAKEEEKSKPVEKRSVRESTKGRSSHEGLSDARIPQKVPEKLIALEASIPSQDFQEYLAVMTLHNVAVEDEIFLADVIKERTGLNKFKLRAVTRAGLGFVSNISNDKFQVETDQRGKITEYKYDSRLLAFSIPSKSSRSE